MIFFIICARPCAPPIAGGQLIGSPASTGARNVATHLAGRRRIAHPVSRHPSRPVCLMNINSGSVTGGSVTFGSVTGGSVTFGSVTGGSVTGGSSGLILDKQ